MVVEWGDGGLERALERRRSWGVGSGGFSLGRMGFWKEPVNSDIEIPLPGLKRLVLV